MEENLMNEHGMRKEVAETGKENTVRLEIELLGRDILLPSYSHPWDAAFDLRSRVDEVISPMERKVIPTGIKVAIPPGHAGLIWDRSGLAAKNGLHTLAGVIDSGYRGEVGVVLINLGKDTFTIEKGMRIAQMLIQPVVCAGIVEVASLSQTARGEGGFGSTGTK